MGNVDARNKIKLKYRLKKHPERLKGIVNLESSKSESNRALIIHALAGNGGRLTHLAGARDTDTMKSLLNSHSNILDVKDAGTTMRFLTAYLAIVGEGQVITGTDRMKKRPIGPLVEALRKIGADIEYVEEEGFPPLKISKIVDQKSDFIKIPGNISSQYISALMMISPYLKKGLTIQLTTEVFSLPYIELTMNLMAKFGVGVDFKDDTIFIPSGSYTPTNHEIEGDWSGASYWYSFVALASKKSALTLPRIRAYSSQGDRVISELMYKLGVSSHFEHGKVKIVKTNMDTPTIEIDFRNCPDLAQTVMVAAAALNVTLHMTGLESLKIKETDRILAMKAELAKMDAMLLESTKKWVLKPSESLPSSLHVETYEDHRMAMAFAPLSQLMDVTINDPEVVNKSYPGFWDEIRKLGIEIEEC